jgi:hypothetical protein
MFKLSYKEIQTIQENTTKKLIKYINDFIKKYKSLDSIEFYYPDFDEQKTMIAFNVWVSIDYKTDYGKSFIEHMLEEKSNKLSSLEKEILIERNKTHISLFEVLEIKGEYIYIIDLLTKKNYNIYEPNIVNMLKPSDLIFGRVGKIIDYEGFVGNINFLPPSIKDIFIEKIFLDYNRIRLKEPRLPIDKYLKQYSINIYKIYTECVYEIIEIDEDITSILYDELEEFESYLQLHMARPKIKKHITNLINLFEYFLMDEEMTLYDLDQVDLEYLLDQAINDGFISSQRELNSYISTLKKYLGYLKCKGPVYKESYEKILKISKNRFLYTNNIKQTKPPFNINRNLSNGIAHILNEESFDFIMDFERFILYIMNNPLEATDKNKYIKRKDLLKINEIMENKEIITKKSPNQKDFPIIHLFYNFSIYNHLIKLDGKHLTATKKSSQFLRLVDEEKYSLFVQYIWSDEFLSYISNTLRSNDLKSTRENILALLSNLEENTYYKYSSLLPACIKFPEFLLSYYKYLKLMGLLEYDYHPYLNISLTSFGKLVFKILAKKDDLINKNGKIINLNTYKESR